MLDHADDLGCQREWGVYSRLGVEVCRKALGRLDPGQVLLYKTSVTEYVPGLGQSKPVEKLKQRVCPDEAKVGKDRDVLM